MDEPALASTSDSVNEDGTKPAKPTDPSKVTIRFLENKKKVMKKSQYRERFDALAAEIDLNIINTTVSYGQKIYEKTGWGSMVFYNKMSNGAYDINVYPQKVADRDQNRSGVPVSQEPIALSKILIATSVLAGKLPDAEVISDDKVYAKTIYELWKRTWYLKGGNGENTLSLTYQNLLTYGWAAWRVYPRRVSVQRNGVEKILFDDIYREPMDPKRTWLGLGANNGDYWSAFEVYYEKDMLKEEFYEKYPDAKNNSKKLEYCTTSEEAKDENQEKAQRSVTIGYYENVLLNRFIVACGKMVIYDGELPNDGSHGSILVARCFVKNILDPHGVGLYEMMRGNTALFTYINSLNAQQVEAEIFPLLFGPQVQNGTGTYKRSPNVVNPKTPGSTIDVIKTSGNVQQGISFADKQKLAIEENTGVNNIVAGQNAESTLGSTVILKEAAYNRLTPPRNSMMNALQTDAHIACSWIEQTYPVDKVFMINSSEKVQEFIRQNPDYFIQSQQIVDDQNNPTGRHVAVASKNLRLNFDFTPDGQLLENVPARVISSKRMFDDMAAHGHKSDYYEFIMDPDSMLLPSIEIQKQTFTAMFPIITNQLNLIFQLRLSDPSAAASQLKALEQFLKIHREDIADYISKKEYDSIMTMQPPQNVPSAPTKDPSESINYKDVPDDIKRQMEAKAGFEPSQEGGAGVTGGAPANVPVKKDNVPGISSDNSGQPKGDNQIGKPRGPLGSSIDASLGRASRLPFFPGA